MLVLYTGSIHKKTMLLKILLFHLQIAMDCAAVLPPLNHFYYHRVEPVTVFF